MSDVDKRVVQMDFDNKKFEKNVKQSTESVNNLKKTLNFDGVSNSIDQVSLKIKAFEIMTTTALVNITNQVVNLGIRMVKSLSVDNISAGWVKYGQKTTSVATMMAQNFKVAGREITDTAERMSIVTDQLERLSWFSDETSYTFTDMVDNVGKFIAAGQDLDVSVKAMEGIATWAALSGQNAATASRAMYQLAQAMGKGKIQLIDYKSIQNANMDTVEFRQTILEAAVALGELTKEGDKFVTKTGKKFTQNQFAEELSSGWFTSKVLVEGLSKYSAAVDQIYELANKDGITASEVIEKYGDNLDVFGLKAFKAAQEARTFADVLNSVRDAVSSKWMETAEIIFGNKDEAVELWTELANALYEVFAEAGNFRNEILKVWKALGGREDLFKRGGPDQGAFWNIYDAIVNLKKLIKSAWNTIFPLSQMEDESDQAREIGNNLKTLTKSFQAFTKKLEMSEVTSLRLRKIFEGLFSILKFGIQVLNAIRYILDPIFELGKKLISVVLDKIVGLINSVQISGEFLFKTAEKINDVITSIFEASFDFSGILGSIINLLKTLVSAIGKIFKQLFEFIKQSKIFISISDVIQKFINNVAKGIEKIQPLLNSLLNVVKKVIKVLLQIPRALNNISKSLTGKGIIENLATFLDRIVELFDKFEQGLSTNGSIGDGVTILSPLEHFFYGIGTFLNGLFTILKSLVLLVGKVLEVAGKIFTDLGNLITNAIQGTLKIDKKILILLAILTPLAVSIGAAVSMALNIGWMVVALKKPLAIIADSVSGILDKISLQMLANAIKTFSESILNISISLLILAGINIGKLWNAVGVFTVVAIILTAITIALFKIGKTAKTVTTAVGFVQNQTVTIRQSIIGVMDEVKSTVASFKQLAGISMMSDLLRTFSTAFLKIAAAFLIISKLEPEDIKKGFMVMAAMLAEVYLLIKAAGDKKVDVKGATPTIIQMLAFSMLLKSFANVLKSFKGFGDEDRVNVTIAFVTILILITVIGAIVTEINNMDLKPDSMKSLSLLLLSMSVTLLSFSKSMKTMSDIPWDAAGRSVGYMLALIVPLMGGLIALNKLGVVSEGYKFNKIENQIASISLLLLSFALAVKIIGDQKWDDAGRGVGYILAFIGPLMGLLVVLNRFSAIDSNKQLASITNQILSISVLLMTFGSVIGILSLTDYGKGWSAVGEVVVFLGAMTGMLILLNMYASNSANADLTEVPKQINAVSNILLAFAVVIGILSLVDTKKGAIYVGLVTGFMASLLTMLLLLNRYGTYLGGGGIANDLTKQLEVLTRVLMIFGGLIVALSFVDYKAGSVYAALMAGFLVIVVWVLNELNNIVKKTDGHSLKQVSLQLALLGGILAIFGGLVAALSYTDYVAGSVYTGLLVGFLYSITGVLAILNAIAKNDYIYPSTLAIQLGELAGLATIFGTFIYAMSFVDYTSGAIYTALLIGFLYSITGVLAILNKIAKDDYTDLSLVSIQLGTLTALLAMFGTFVYAMSFIDYTSSAIYTALLIGFLYSITGVLAILNKIDIQNGKDILLQLSGVALLLVAFGMSMATLATVPWQSILAATLGLSAVLLSVLGIEAGLTAVGKSGIDILKDMAGISGGVLLLSASLLILSAAFQAFSSIRFDSIGKAAVVVAGAFMLLIATATLLKATNLTPILIALSGSMVLVGVGMLTAAMAIQILVNVLGTIAQMSSTSIQAVSENLNTLAQVLSTALLVGLQSLFDNLNTLLPSMFETISIVIDGILSLISEKVPMIVETLLSIVDKFLVSLDEHAESIFNSVMSILNKLLTSLDNNAESISKKLVDILLKIIKTAGNRADDIIAGILSFAIDLIKGLLKNEQLLKELVSNLLKFIMNAIIGIAQNIVGLAGAIAKVLLILLSAAMQIVTASLGGLASLMLEFISAFLLVLVHTVIGMQDIIFETFLTIMYNVIKIFNKVLQKVGPMLAVMLKTGFNSLLAGILEAIAILIKDIPVLNLLYDKINNAAQSMKASAQDTMNEYADIMRGDNVISAVKEASTNIRNTVKQSMSAMKDTTTDVMNDINSAMTDSMSKLGDTMTDLAKQATNGFNMTLNDGIDETKKTGVDLGDAVSEGVASAESLDIHSPSRKMAKLGIYAIQGLINGIDEKKDEVVDTMTSMVSNAVNATQDTIENQNGDDLTIKVGMDISGVEAQSKKITDIMTGINKVDTTVYGKNALYASRSTRKSNSEQSVTNTDNSSNVTYNNVFNVSSTDPQRSADEIDKVLNRQAIKARLARGAI